MHLSTVCMYAIMIAQYVKEITVFQPKCFFRTQFKLPLSFLTLLWPVCNIQLNVHMLQISKCSSSQCLNVSRCVPWSDKLFRLHCLFPGVTIPFFFYNSTTVYMSQLV